MSYSVNIKLDAPSASYDVGRVAAAVGLAMSDYEGTEDLVVREIWVEEEEGRI